MAGTVFHLGYGGQLDDRRALRFNELARVRDQLFVKGSYLVRIQEPIRSGGHWERQKSGSHLVSGSRFSPFQFIAPWLAPQAAG